MKVHRRTVLLIAVAIFAQEVVWNFYDAQVPAELRRYLSSAALIGLVMGIDNVAGIFVQPWMGQVSDARLARRGHRLGLLVVGAPVAAILFALLPWATGLATLIPLIVAFALVANGFRPVTESLLADYVAPDRRSRANGFLKIAAALTVVASAVISLRLVDDHLKLAFALPPLMLVLGLAIAGTGLRRVPLAVSGDGSPGERGGYRALLRDRTSLLILLGVFGFNALWQALRSLFTPYAMEVLQVSRGTAGSLSIVGALAFVLVAAPIALVSQRIGQLRMITFGAAVFTVGLGCGAVSHTVTVTLFSLCVAAIGFAAFAVNAIIAVWNSAPSPAHTGLYTGFYAVAYGIGAAIGPALLGLTVDLTGWPSLMTNATLLSLPTLALFIHLTRRSRSTPATEAARVQ
ncbi:MAG TPA: MFS transporter [Kribbella sp.]